MASDAVAATRRRFFGGIAGEVAPGAGIENLTVSDATESSEAFALMAQLHVYL